MEMLIGRKTFFFGHRFLQSFVPHFIEQTHSIKKQLIPQVLLSILQTLNIQFLLKRHTFSQKSLLIENL